MINRDRLETAFDRARQESKFKGIEFPTLPVDGLLLTPILGRQKVVSTSIAPRGQRDKIVPNLPWMANTRIHPGDIWEHMGIEEPHRWRTLEVLVERARWGDIPMRLRKDIPKEVYSARAESGAPLEDGFVVRLGFHNFDKRFREARPEYDFTFYPGEEQGIPIRGAVPILLSPWFGQWLEEVPEKKRGRPRKQTTIQPVVSA